jgi:YHS domain-containing protein
MQTEAPLAFDPVCGMWLKPGQIAATHDYLGQTYAFCCAECCKLFERAPDACIVLMAHEPGQSMGYRCPVLRQAQEGQKGDGEDPS